LCIKTVSRKRFSCGDGREEIVKFETCGDMIKDGDELKVTTLGCKRVGRKCGEYGCRNP
jgi:hypothetical protein